MNSKQSRKRMSGGWLGCALRFLTIALAVAALSVPAFSQGNTGRVLGTVTDQSGGTIAGATVSVVDVDRGVTRTLTTDDAGEYNAPNLTPGNYTVRAEAKGFKKLERQNVVIEVAKELRVDLTLQPGAQEQTVTVTEAVPLVDTTTATLGGTLENSEIVDLPLNGRDYQSLLGLRPGVMLMPGGGPWTQSTNGVRPDQSVWMIDGVINSNFFDARPIAGMPSPITDGATILPIDSIQEFNLMENPKSEYGWKPGAVVNVGIKSGTNSLHGTAYGFYRSSAWDARNYFNVVAEPNGTCLVGAAAACDKTPAQLKQFGASVGGPIIKDKLFFFTNYEGLRDSIGNAFGTTGGTGVPETGTSNTDTANNMAAAINCLAFPSAATCGPNGPTTVIPISQLTLDLTGCQVGTTASATACSGGFFPSNPTNGTGFLSTIPNVNNTDNGVAKVDYHISDKNSLNGVFIIGRYNGDGEDRGFINRIFNNSYIINTWTGSGNWDYTPTSNIVNEVRFGYNQMAFITGSDDANIKDPLTTGATVPGFPTISVSPFGLFGTWHNRPQAISPNPYYDAQDSLSYLAGKHSLKFGGEYTHIEADSYIPDYGRGRINFGGGSAFNITFPCPTPTNPTKTCQNPSSALEDFFAGDPSSGQFLVGNPKRSMIWTNLAGFAQDDWRITPKFMLNVGLRYEYRSPIREANNLWANFDPNSPTGLTQQGAPGESTMWKPDRGDFSPRVGFAYDLNGKGTTVVRGGFSVIYETFTAVEWMNQNQFQNNSSVTLAANPTGAQIVYCPSSCSTPSSPTFGVPVTLAPTGNVAVKASKFGGSALCWDPAVSACPSGQTTVFPSSATLACGDGAKVTGGSDPGPCNLMAVDPNLKTPYVLNFNLGVTHAFTNDLSLEIGYVGNHGARLTGFADINQCAPYDTTSKTATCVQPYGSRFPWFNFINYMSNDVRSNYHSMQATLTKRMSHGVSFVAGYTFAHGLDNGSLNRFALLPQNANDPGAEYGNSDFDVRHRFTFTATYNIPGIKGFAQLLEGWQLNGIVTLESGQPWTVDDYNNNFSGSGDSADRWDFFGNPADFKGAQNSLMYCTGGGDAGCSTTAGVTNVATCGNVAGQAVNPKFPGYCSASQSAPFWTECTTVQAAHPESQLGGGCFISGNSVMLGPANGTFGTMGRNIFRDSGYRNLDLSVFKTFTWKERYSAQFRLEMFNVFNHPVFANPYGASQGSSGGNNDPSAPTAFGGAIGTPDVVAGNPLVGSGDSRNVQVGLKLTF